MTVKALATNTDGWYGRPHNFKKGIEKGTSIHQVMDDLGILDIGVEKAPLYLLKNELSLGILKQVINHLHNVDESNWQSALELVKSQGSQVLKSIIKTDSENIVLKNVPWNDDGIEYLSRNVKNYEPITNKFLADIWNPMIDQGFNLTSVGQLGSQGQITIIEFELPPFYIGEEEHKKNLIIGNNHIGGSGFAGTTFTRFKCLNMYYSTLRQVNSIRHSSSSKIMFEYVAQVQEAIAKQQKEEYEMLNKMFNTQVKEGQVNKVVKKVFPDAKKSKNLRTFENNIERVTLSSEQKELYEEELSSFESAQERVERRRHGLTQEFFKFNDNNDNQGKGSVYALFNAGTATMNHNGDLFNKTNTVDGVASLLFGSRKQLQDNLYNACAELVK